MARLFEKISFEQFKKDICDDIDLYNSYNIPKRSTKESAGYDFESIINTASVNAFVDWIFNFYDKKELY